MYRTTLREKERRLRAFICAATTYGEAEEFEALADLAADMGHSRGVLRRILDGLGALSADGRYGRV